MPAQTSRELPADVMHHSVQTTSIRGLAPSHERPVPAGARRRHVVLTVLCTLLVLWPGYSEFEPAARAQESASRDPAQAAVAPPRGMPLADPVLHKDAVLEAGRTTVWQEQGMQWLLLEGNVQIQMGAYGFRAQRAVARIHEQIDRNTIVRHLWV